MSGPLWFCLGGMSSVQGRLKGLIIFYLVILFYRVSASLRRIYRGMIIISNYEILLFFGCHDLNKYYFCGVSNETLVSVRIYKLIKPHENMRHVALRLHFLVIGKVLSQVKKSHTI